jgi:hypothetical protein
MEHVTISENTWNQLNTEPGATGPNGLEGFKGPTGWAGANGVDGVNGATGPDGPTGPNGNIYLSSTPVLRVGTTNEFDMVWSLSYA